MSLSNEELKKQNENKQYQIELSKTTGLKKLLEKYTYNYIKNK